jgi:DNA polymerase-3 subunit epsilon
MQGVVMLLRDTSFVVVDVETTGLSAAQHRITEIALVRLAPTPNEGGGWGVVESFQTLVNPEQFISPFITQHTGITNAMVYDKPRFREIVPEIKNFLAKSESPVLVGHNVKFDHGFLLASFGRAGEEFHAHGPLCTCRLARRLLPQLRSKSLKSVQDHFGIRNPRQHRALADADATAKILAHFIEQARLLEIETLEEFLRLQFSKPPEVRRKTKKELSLREKVRQFPERPGVYTMTSRSGEVLYVGKAKSLHDRVATYFTQSSTEGTKLTRMMRAVQDIIYEETGSELSALLLESRKIKELYPRFNSLDRRYKPQSFLRLDVQNDFPELSFSREPAPDGAEYFGPFRSREATEALMEILNRAFKLRKCGDKFRVGLGVKPCIYHEMHSCDAPCALLQTKESYRSEVTRLQEFLAAGDDGILAHVEQLMRNAADELDFEEAQFFKDRLFELRRVLGTGDRPSASLSSNDFVILNPLDTKECEIYFVRFGQLMKQMILSVNHIPNADEWFHRQLRLYYGATSAIPPTAGRPEIDEMRILSRWVESSKKKGSKIIYLSEPWENAVTKLVGELKTILSEP